MYYYPNIRHASLLAACSWASLAQAQSTVTVTPAAKATAASGISQELDRSFAGMGIEPSNLFSFTGRETPNQLSINLLQNLADYSGAPPHLRIGGNTGDYMIYNITFQEYTVEANEYAVNNGGESGNGFIIGPKYLAALDRFPTDTPITYGLNFGYTGDDYLDVVVAIAQGVLDELNNTKVYSFEIGNEPDLYLESWNLLRTGTWDGTTYTQQFLERAAAVYEQVLKPHGISSTFFETAQTASTIGTSFTIDDLNSDGITASTNGSKYIASWNQHDYFYFIDVSTEVLTLDYMMDLDNTDSQFKYWASEIATALKTGLPYNLREMQDVGPTGAQGVSNTFGAALWQLNFFCYAATLNISSVQMHMTDNSYAAPWQPTNITSPYVPHVRSNYYAWAAFTQLIGSGNGTTQISALDLSTSMSYVRAYASYAKGSLDAVIVVNSNQVNASSTDKANLTVSVDLSGYSGQTLYLSYLTADGADSQFNTTWNGISYEQNDLGTPSNIGPSASTVKIGSNGIASIPVRDSQAVIARIGAAIGSTDASVPSSTSSSGSSSSIAISNASASTTKKSGAGKISASILMALLALVPSLM
ncbi:hypothetical protein BDV97DRAFT_355893 [Delphinella strobiligena]|nr:hypothetical protein BDV97DRAFT_355893 [Delphinella strobiligena]